MGIVNPSVGIPRSTYQEGTVQTGITTGNNDFSIDLSQGTVNQIIKRVTISTPGVTGNLTIIFYDGIPATTPVSGTLYLGAQPAGGFMLNKVVVSGTIGFRLAGMSGGNKNTVFVNVEYEP